MGLSWCAVVRERDRAVALFTPLCSAPDGIYVPESADEIPVVSAFMKRGAVKNPSKNQEQMRVQHYCSCLCCDTHGDVVLSECYFSERGNTVLAD